LIIGNKKEKFFRITNKRKVREKAIFMCAVSAPMNLFTITPETCSGKVNGANLDFTFTSMHVPVVIGNDSFVLFSKVINGQALLFFNPLPSSLNLVNSQLTQSCFFSQ